MTVKQEQAMQEAKLKIQGLQERIQQFKSSDEFLGFLKTMSRFHRYSFSNQLLILAQKPNATHVAGFRAWKQLGRYVRKGERGISIMVPLKNLKRDEVTDEEQAIVVGYSVGYVFDISQTDGEPLPNIDLSMENHGREFMTQCMMLAKKMGVTVMMRESMRADGLSTGGKVILRRDDNPSYMAATLLHELAHEKLHHGPEEELLSREQRELEAETVAYLVCDRFGIGIPAHKYLATWHQSADIMDSLRRIADCTPELIDGLEPVRQVTSA